MKQKILITGSNGFIGQKLMSEILANKEFDLIALSKGKNRYKGSGSYCYVEGDICNAENMSTILKDHRPHIIINTVAMANVEVCEKEKDQCKAINTEAVELLVALGKVHGFHLIHLSTDFVFDGQNGPYKETDQTKPLSEYGKSKLQAEISIGVGDIKSTIVRTILVFGVPQERGKSNFVLWVKKSLEEGNEINVVNDQFRMPTFVEDLVSAIMVIIKKKALGIYHISGAEVFSIYDIAMQVAAYWKLDSTLIKSVSSRTMESVVQRPKYTGFILDKARSDLQYNPHSFMEALKIIDNQLSQTSQSGDV